MERELLFRLIQVRRRLRQQLCWRRLALAACLAASISMLLGLSSEPLSKLVLHWMAAGFVVSFVLVLWTSARRYTSLVGVAHQVETQFPELQQRLLTAATRLEAPSPGHRGYLEATVIQESLQHGMFSSWLAIAPLGRIWLNRMIAVAGIGLTGTLLGQAYLRPARALSVAPTPEALRLPIGAPDVVVRPGDADVERGSSLIISARFPEPVPSDAVLWIEPDGQSARRIPMKRSLDDPLFAVHLSEVRQPTDYRVEFSGDATDAFRLNVFDYPKLLQADAHLDYPDYTRLRDKQITDTRRVSAVEGSQLTWIARLNKRVSHAWLESSNGDRLQLERAGNDPRAYSLSVPLAEDQRWTLHLEDEQGRPNKVPPELIVRVLRNRAPQFNPTVAGDVSVSPLQELTVSASAWDDFGMSRYGIGYAIGSESPREEVIGTDAAAQRKINVAYGLDFEAMEAEPDHALAYHFWAEDVGPDGNVRRTVSDIYFADVRHFEEIFRKGQAQPGGQSQSGQMGQNAQQSQQLLEMQREIISATWNVHRGDRPAENADGFEDEVQVIVEAQQQALETLLQLSQRVSDGRSAEFVQRIQLEMEAAIDDLREAILKNKNSRLTKALVHEQASYQGLLSLRAREHEVTRQASSSAAASSGRGGSARQQQLDELELENDINRYETQQQAERQTEDEASEREMRQVLSRLRDLARRQQDVNEQLRELQLALQRARTPEEHDEIARQLKRLRDQQEEMLRDTDEAQQRLDQAADQPKMQETRQQLEQTREQLQRSAQATSDGNVSQALSAGTRTEEQFEQMTDALRNQMSTRFGERARQLQESARELDARQKEIAEQLNDTDGRSPGLRPGSQTEPLQDRLSDQRDRLKGLMDEIQETVQEADEVEPLLAQKLYDAFRDATQNQIDEQLQMSRRLLENGLRDEARDAENSARQGIQQLRAGIEDAADAVLGNDVEGLRRAAATLGGLAEELNEEIDAAESRDPTATGRTDNANPGNEQSPRPEVPTQGGQRQEGRPQGSRPQGSRRQGGRAPSAAPQESQPRDSQPQSGERSAGQPGAGQPPTAQHPDGQPHPNQQDNRSPSGPSAASGRGGLLQSMRVDGGTGPMTGDNFRAWSDRLRDVEEMVDDAELRARAAQIRDRARNIRRDMQRRSAEPQWNLIRDMVATPLDELRQQVAQELARRSGQRDQLVPIDRDPIPKRFDDRVRKYYERLGQGE